MNLRLTFFTSVIVMLSCIAGTAIAEPQGKIRRGVFDQSQVFPGTTRDYAVYVPDQYSADAKQPAGLMVFMDGMNYLKADGAFNVPEVFDQLIAAGDMPVTVAVFVNPGTIPAIKPDASDRSNRSFEYDAPSDRYATFLVDEFLPVALDGLTVSGDPGDRAVCGISSGGICAFTAAWQRPDQFGKVLSHIGSFTNIRGGWAYPGLIRQTKESPKPIKVYLHDGVDDLDNLHGNWPLGNRDMAAALQYAGYKYKMEMTQGGHTGKYAGEVFPAALRWLWDNDAKSTVLPPQQTKERWEPSPDQITQAGVPVGKVIDMPPLQSKIFAGTVRDWSIYVPDQYDSEQPASLLVVQDGQRLADKNGKWRMPIVMDNLIASGEMPVTIGVFINPGQHKDRPSRKGKYSNRSDEYDSLGDRYARFLAEEVLPIVKSKYNISADPEQHAIAGSSSGGIAAFNVAWERPDLFRKVYTSVGSFTNLRGGDALAGLVRKTEPKPIRIYMADTSGDVDNAFGSWPIANQLMHAALSYMGYDVRLDWAEGYSHGPDFGSTRFADAMRWVWRDEVAEPSIDTRDDLRGDMTLLKLLIPGEDWQIVASDLGFADAPCSDEAGNFYFCDMKAPAVYRVDAAGQSRDVVARVAVSGLMFGPDGLLYGCQGRQKRLISIDPVTGAVATIAENVVPNDLAVTDDGFALITETQSSQVTRINLDSGETTVVDTGIERPNGIALSGDGGTLAVSASGDSVTWTFRVHPGGTLDAKMPTMPMRLAIDPKGSFSFNSPPPYVPASRGDGMAFDLAGRYYITSSVGIQIFDPTGRLCGVLPAPDADKPLTSCALAGPDHSYLYVTNGPTVYRRRLQL